MTDSNKSSGSKPTTSPPSKTSSEVPEGGRFYFRVGMYWLTKVKDRWVKVIEVPPEKVISELEKKIAETGSLSAAVKSIEQEMRQVLRRM